jgi:hypothetical protein
MKKPIKPKQQSKIFKAIKFIQPDLFSLDDTPVPPFLGTKNPRHLRALGELVKRVSVSREALDKIAGCSNAPDLVSELRRLGLQLPCDKVQVLDRDGRICLAGWYYLTALDRMLIENWLVAAGAKF